MLPRALGLALLVALPPALTLNPGTPHSKAPLNGLVAGPRAADAAVSVQLSLNELVASATYVVVATAGERRSQWELLGGKRRIVTYTRLTVDAAVAGDPDSEIWVRTLGGVVGKIGQAVSGDARIVPGTQSLLFLTRASNAVIVTGMAQGHYPVLDAAATGGDKRLAASPDAGAVLPRPGPALAAREALAGAKLDDAVTAVARAWKDRHATQ